MANPSFEEREAQRALRAAFAAVIVAEEKCRAADYGSEVRATCEEARKAIAYAVALVEGRV